MGTIISYNPSTKTISQNTGISFSIIYPGINIYSVDFADRLKDYMTTLFADISSIVSEIQTDYESANIFKVSGLKPFQVTDGTNTVFEIQSDSNGVKVVLGTDVIANSITALSKLSVSEVATIKNAVIKTHLQIVNSLSTGIAFDLSYDGISFINLTSKNKILDIQSDKVIVNQSLEVANDLNVYGKLTMDLTTGETADIGSMKIEQDKITFEGDLILTKGAYLFDSTPGNEVALSSEIENVYNEINDKISLFESNLSGFYDTLNITLVKVNLEQIKYVNMVSPTVTIDFPDKTIYPTKQNSQVGIKITNSNFFNLGIKDFKVNMDFPDINYIKTARIKSVVMYSCSSSGSSLKPAVTTNSYGTQNISTSNTKSFTLSDLISSMASSVAIPAGTMFSKVKINFAIEDTKGKYMSFILDVGV